MPICRPPDLGCRRWAWCALPVAIAVSFAGFHFLADRSRAASEETVVEGFAKAGGPAGFGPNGLISGSPGAAAESLRSSLARLESTGVRMESRVQGADGKPGRLPVGAISRSGRSPVSESPLSGPGDAGDGGARDAYAQPRGTEGRPGIDSQTGIATTRKDGSLELATTRIPLSATFTPGELTRSLVVRAPFDGEGTMSVRGDSPVLLDGKELERGVEVPVDGGGLIQSNGEVRIEFRPGTPMPPPGNSG